MANELEREEGTEAQVELLRNEDDGKNSCVRLAEALLNLMNVRDLQKNISIYLNSCLMIDDANGLGQSRRVRIKQSGSSNRRTGYIYSFTLSNSALEYLVHRHLRSDGKNHKPRALSFPQFLDILRERYGICVDRSPPDMDIPSELLQRNRRILERRLRDLGLLVGVNDAERMKRLRQRYLSKFDTQFADEKAVQA